MLQTLSDFPILYDLSKEQMKLINKAARDLQNKESKSNQLQSSLIELEKARTLITAYQEVQNLSPAPEESFRVENHDIDGDQSTDLRILKAPDFTTVIETIHNWESSLWNNNENMFIS